VRRLLPALVLLTWLAVSPAPGHARGGLVVYGYPYADRCPVAGLADAVDRWEMDECNCTSYVAWALEANGQRTDWLIAGAMDAWNWPHVAQLAGLATGTTPRVRAVAVWPHVSHFGHVAYVTGVGPDGRFSVAEYNAPGGLAVFGFDQRRGLTAAGAVFIYVPRR
jgi:surface antigen